MPVLLMSFEIKRNSSPEHCFGKTAPGLLAWFKFALFYGWLGRAA